jgi:two-component system CitB family response regulator
MNNIRVVIAEDDKQIAEIHRRFLERIEGFELAGLAHGLDETKDLIDILKPDLVLLDNQFPSGTGLELLRDLRAKNSSVDIILITAAKEVNTLREALRGGIFDYILKPLVFDRLQETLQNYQQQIHKLQTIESIDQGNVDTMLSRKSNVNELERQDVRLPKGIDALTLEKIKKAFNEESPPLSAEEVGELIGASRTTARRYLEYLVGANELVAEINYGSVGRPERRYGIKLH